MDIGTKGRASSARPVDLLLPEGDPAWDEVSALLQAGFLVESRPGISARDFMRHTLGFEDEYIEGEVSTVFINFEPVDDIDAATLSEGSLIALSAAMPGLVGAVMRRKSPYASFREAISYAQPAATAGGTAQGGTGALVRVKLFNSVMWDKGPEILARGILVEEKAAAALLAGKSAAAPGPDGGLVRLRVRKEDGGAP